jgi:hypothetical protein
MIKYIYHYYIINVYNTIFIICLILMIYILMRYEYYSFIIGINWNYVIERAILASENMRKNTCVSYIN